MVQQIRTFVYQTFVRTITCLDDSLNSFLAYLLRHFIDAGLKQTGSVGTFRHFGMTLVNEILKKF